MQHTPTPYKVVKETTGKGDVSHFIQEVNADPPDTIARIVYINEAEANAQFIVKCCNNFNQLLYACKEARDGLGDEDGDMTMDEMQLFDILTDAIDKAIAEAN